jgi:citronellol/citronellal dehydrogenase
MVKPMMKIIHSLRNKVVVVSGASRGIGREIAIRCGMDGAKVVLLGRSFDAASHPALDGNLKKVAEEVEQLGGQALPIKVDLRKSSDIKAAASIVSNKFGTVDCVVNNSSAITVEPFPELKHYDNMMNINVRGTYTMIREFYDMLLQSDTKQVLTISPPLKTLSYQYICPHPVYTASKYSMSMMTIGYSSSIRANTLWPKKLIATAATKMLEHKTGIPAYTKGVSATLFAETAHTILCSDATGQCFLDDEIFPVDENGIDDIFI